MIPQNVWSWTANGVELFVKRWLIVMHGARSLCNCSFISGRSLVIVGTPLTSITSERDCWHLRLSQWIHATFSIHKVKAVGGTEVKGLDLNFQSLKCFLVFFKKDPFSNVLCVCVCVVWPYVWACETSHPSDAAVIGSELLDPIPGQPPLTKSLWELQQQWFLRGWGMLRADERENTGSPSPASASS